MGEARPRGCYHATLRKAVRAVVGEREFDKVMYGTGRSKQKLKLSEEDVIEIVTRLEARATTLDEERERLHCALPTLHKNLRVILGQERYLELRQSLPRRRPSPAAPKIDLAPKVDPTPALPEEPKCGHRFMGGTDGNGHAFLWCVACGYEEAIIAQRLASVASSDADEDE
jgi:hypothetical protein